MSKRTHDDRKKLDESTPVFKIPNKEMMVTRGRKVKLRRQLRNNANPLRDRSLLQKSPKPPAKVRSPSSREKIPDKPKPAQKVVLQPLQKLRKIEMQAKNKRKSSCPQKRSDITPIKETTCSVLLTKQSTSNVLPVKQNSGTVPVKKNPVTSETDAKRSLKQRCLEDERAEHKNLAEVIRMRELTEELTDEDLLEIVQCPSPVWWEEPPDERCNEVPTTALPTITTNKKKTAEKKAQTKFQPVNVAQIQDSQCMQEFLTKRTVLENVLSGLKTKGNESSTKPESLRQPSRPIDWVIPNKKSSLLRSIGIDKTKTFVEKAQKSSTRPNASDLQESKSLLVLSECINVENPENPSSQTNVCETPINYEESNLPNLEKIGMPTSISGDNTSHTVNIKTKTSHDTNEIVKKMHAHLPKIKAVTANCMKILKIIPHGKRVYSGNDSAELIPCKENSFDVIDLSDDPEEKIYNASSSETIVIESPVNEAGKSLDEDVVKIVEDNVVKDLENLTIPISMDPQECIVIDEDDGNAQCEEERVPFLGKLESPRTPVMLQVEMDLEMAKDSDKVNQHLNGKENKSGSVVDNYQTKNLEQGVKRKFDHDLDADKDSKRKCLAPSTTNADKKDSKSVTEEKSVDSFKLNDKIQAKTPSNMIEKRLDQDELLFCNNIQTDSKNSHQSDQLDKIVENKTANTEHIQTNPKKSTNPEASNKSKLVMSKIKQAYQELISKRDMRMSSSSSNSAECTSEVATDKEKSDETKLKAENFDFISAENKVINWIEPRTVDSNKSEIPLNLHQEDIQNNNQNELDSPKPQDMEVGGDVVIILSKETEPTDATAGATIQVFDSPDVCPITYEIVSSEIEILESLKEPEFSGKFETNEEIKSDPYLEGDSEEEDEYENINRIQMTKEMIDNIIGVQDTKAVTAGPEALEEIVLHGVNPIAASKKNIVIAKNENVKYCFKCSSIYDTEECSYCQKQKRQQSSSPAADRRYNCDMCSYHSKKKSNMEMHTSTHASNKGYFCDLCKSSFKSKITLRNHIMKYCRNMTDTKKTKATTSNFEVKSYRLDSEKTQRQILDESSGYIVILTES